MKRRLLRIRPRTMRCLPPAFIPTTPTMPIFATLRRRERFSKNSIDYWRQSACRHGSGGHPDELDGVPGAHAGLPRDFCQPPLFVYAHSFIPAGYFGAWHRQNGSNYTGDRATCSISPPAITSTIAEANVICSGEYSWNTAAPGSAVFRGWYYDMERDHSEPRVIFNEWVPRACRAFFITELGELLAPVFQAGVLQASWTRPPPWRMPTSSAGG